MPILDWLNKKDALQASAKSPFRLLDEQSKYSYGDENTQNMLIQGDNLDALKALIPFFAGRIKCIIIDPPYNTHSAFEHYDDNLEHSTWLSMMYPRLELLRELLTEEGSIWITIDDNEAHYLKLVCDEIFGRSNFVANVVWQKRTSPDIRATIGAGHDHILVFAKSIEKFKNTVKPIPKTEEQVSKYKNPDNDPRGPWVSSDFTAQGYRPNQMYKITTPGGVVFEPPAGRCWKNIENVFLTLQSEGRIWFGKNGRGIPRKKTYLNESQGHIVWSWWPNNEVGHNQEAKKEIIALFGADNAFDTPKPERLIQRILSITSDEGDWILDSFLGSGTTVAVAHKMQRKWIGVELGEQAITHCFPRLKKVIDGEQGGISKQINWKGGGGFRTFKLGSPIFTPEGVIHPDVRFKTLAAHIWFCETKTPLKVHSKSPFLGEHDKTGYYLLFNGILGDKRPDAGNVLTKQVFKELPKHSGPKVIYGELSLLSKEKMRQLNVTFKQIPYDVRAY